MAKRSAGATQRTGGTTSNRTSGAKAADPIEQRVVAFAEQLGRLAGTVQSKSRGWMDRKALTRQIAGVRDGAVDLLEHLGGGRSKAAKGRTAKAGAKTAKRTSKTSKAAARAGSTGRSGGMVDAPGKKHRKPPPPDPNARILSTQASRLRTANTRARARRLGPGG